MQRMTPTGYAKMGKPLPLLGSLRAVLEALPDDGNALLVARDFEQVSEAALLWHELGREAALAYCVASAGQSAIVAFRAEMVVGVSPDAWRGAFNSTAWLDMQKAIQARFAKVHFG